MEVQAKISEPVKQRNIFLTQSLMKPNIFPSKQCGNGNGKILESAAFGIHKP